MRRPFLAALTTVLIAIPAYGALPDGAKAPDFSTEASLAGKEFKFSLADALKKGPVVLYFYPAAFTPGCTVEAHEFADVFFQAEDGIRDLTVTGVQTCALPISQFVGG